MDKDLMSIEEFTKLLAEAKKGNKSLAVEVDGKRINISGIEDGEDIKTIAVPYAYRPETMTVIGVSPEEYVKFDNGCVIEPYHDASCCEHNFLDFTQFNVGMKFPVIETPADIERQIHIRKDGLYMVTTDGLPIWAQARSSQNGYYSYDVGVMVTLAPHYLIHHDDNNEPMEGKDDDE